MTTLMIYLAKIWVLIFVIRFIVPKLAKKTTIGNQVWFGDLVSSITERIKSNKVAQWITNASYGKLFVCIPCHNFHLSIISSALMFSLYSSPLATLISTVLIGTPLSLMAYFNALGIELKEKQNEKEQK